MPAAVNKVNKMFKYSFFNFLIMYSSFILKFSLGLNPSSNEREREREREMLVSSNRLSKRLEQS